MLQSARLGPGSPDDFMNSFDTSGWHVRVRLGSGASRCLFYSGRDYETARSALSGSGMRLPEREAESLTYRWDDIEGEQHNGYAALVFRKALDDGAELSGTVLLEKSRFQNSNVIGVHGALVFIVEYFLMKARHDLVGIYMNLFKEFSKKVFLSSLIVSRSGEIIVETERGVDFISELLGVAAGNHHQLQRRIECMLTRFENAAGLTEATAEHAAGPDTPACAEDNGRSHRIIKLSADSRDVNDGGPYYAIVEAKEIELLDTDDLCDRYELTPAEARVVGCMMEGSAVPGISRKLQLTDHTVRTYLKRSYNKIGVNGQAQMISKLTRLSCSLGRLPKPVAP